MKEKINLVIPMAGEGRRFKEKGYKDAKPFIKIDQKPLIDHVLRNLFYENMNIYLLVNQKHIDEYATELDQLKQKYRVTIISVAKLTEGAACTVLLARDYINNANPLVIANSDQFVDVNINEFYQKANTCEGLIMTFEDIDPKWSYAKVDGDKVTEVKEKVPISKHATVGIYYFSSGADFVKAADKMIACNDRHNNEFYLCPVYNYYIEKHPNTKIYPINKEQMLGLGTPEDLEKNAHKIS